MRDPGVADWPVKYAAVNKQNDRHCGAYTNQYANVRSITRAIPQLTDPDISVGEPATQTIINALLSPKHYNFIVMDHRRTVEWGAEILCYL